MLELPTSSPIIPRAPIPTYNVVYPWALPWRACVSFGAFPLPQWRSAVTSQRRASNRHMDPLLPRQGFRRTMGSLIRRSIHSIVRSLNGSTTLPLTIAYTVAIQSTDRSVSPLFRSHWTTFQPHWNYIPPSPTYFLLHEKKFFDCFSPVISKR
jgi:hypothetical protein